MDFLIKKLFDLPILYKIFCNNKCKNINTRILLFCETECKHYRDENKINKSSIYILYIINREGQNVPYLIINALRCCKSVCVPMKIL